MIQQIEITLTPKFWLILTAVVLLLSCGNKAKSDLPMSDMDDNGMRRFMENNDEEGWD